MRKIKKSKSTIISALICMMLAMGCVIAVFLVGKYCDTTDVVSLLAMNVLSAVASILGVSAFWEFFAKQSFTSALLSDIGIGENLMKSGITKVYGSFNDINWNEELSDEKKLTVFFVYGKTWRSYNRQLLLTFINNNDFEIIMPDLTNESIITELNRKFKYDKFAIIDSNKHITVADLIFEAIDEFVSWGVKPEKIFLYDKIPNTSYYIFERKSIIALNKHGKSKGSVPAIKIKHAGELFEFVKKEIEEIKEVSRQCNEQLIERLRTEMREKIR